MKQDESTLYLQNIINRDEAALIVIDIQNDFCAIGGMMDREGNDLTFVQKMIPQLRAFIKAVRIYNLPVIFIKNVYNTVGNWYLSESWLTQAKRRRGDSYTKYLVCEPESWGGSFYGGIEPQPYDPIVIKHRFSGFYMTDLDLLLRSRKIKTVILAGVATNVCVDSTARDAFFRDYHVVIISDCCATYNEKVHEFTLDNLDCFFGTVVDSKKIIKCLRKTANSK